MGSIEQRLEKEGIQLKEAEVYSYSPLLKTIYKPVGVLPENKDNAVSIILAHELGHHYQCQNKFLSVFFQSYQRDTRNCLMDALFYPIILSAELDAWKRAKRICLEEDIEMVGFYKIMFNGFGSYLKQFIRSWIELISSLIKIYLGVILLFVFLAISEYLSLNQPQFLIEIRQYFMDNPNSYNDIFWSFYFIGFCAWQIKIVTNRVLNSKKIY